MDTTYRITIGANALDDHMDRLYDEWTRRSMNTNATPHVDGPASGVITIIKRNARTIVADMTRPAVQEFISDMKYQVEFMDCPTMGEYRAQCRRALSSMKKQTER